MRLFSCDRDFGMVWEWGGGLFRCGVVLVVGSFVVWSPRVVDAQWLIDVQSTGLCCAGLKEEIFKIVLC